MTIPDNSAKSRQIRIIDQDDSTVIATPYLLPFIRLEITPQYAIFHLKNVYENGI
jgi:hypothetical protein